MSERIRTAFGFGSTADEVIRRIDLSGKRALVTGGAAGIGFETARALASAGADVTLGVRRLDAAAQAVAELKVSTRNPNVRAQPLDLADQASVRSFCAAWMGPLHILVNNAGIMALPDLELTPEGWEMQFATNFLGHFALTLGLHEALATAGGARIVNVSSSAHMFAPVFLDDLAFSFIPYAPFVAYGQSKTALILMAVEATRRWSEEGIFANSLNPGAIPTALQKHIGAMKTPPERRKTPAQGAATPVLAAVHPALEGIGGRYLEDCNEAEFVPRRPTDFTGGVARYALDPENARRLWEQATGLVSQGP